MICTRNQKVNAEILYNIIEYYLKSGNDIQIVCVNAIQDNIEEKYKKERQELKAKERQERKLLEKKKGSHEIIEEIPSDSKDFSNNFHELENTNINNQTNEVLDQLGNKLLFDDINNLISSF